MSEVTRILNAIAQDDPHAAEQLLPLVYDELRRLAAQKLAHERPGQTLQPTALVHEAYRRLVGTPPVEALAFAADGKTLAFTGPGSGIHLLDLTSPVPMERAVLEGHQLPGWDGVVRSFCFSADGRQLASAGRDGRVIVWATATGKPVHEWKFPGQVGAVAFASDGRHVATGNQNGTIYILRLAPVAGRE